MRRNRELMRADMSKVGACPVARRQHERTFANLASVWHLRHPLQEGLAVPVTDTTEVDGERCPTCGCEPDDDTAHRDGCERIDTCAQTGPPWIDPPWHRYDDHPIRLSDDSHKDYAARWQRYWETLDEHRRTEHGVG